MNSQINKLNGQSYKFSVACYDSNSIEELQAPHNPDDADQTDCNEWGISSEEWSIAIESALHDRLSEYA